MTTTTEYTPRLSMPFLSAAQAQKHVTINESFRVLDVLVQTQVEDMTLTEPPISIAQGQVFWVAENASGAWSGQDRHLAAYQDAAWIFYPPMAGWRVYDSATSTLKVYDGNNWTQIGAGLELNDLTNGSLQALGVNTSADAYNRLAIKTDGGFFSHDDVTPGSGDVRIDYNKRDTGNTAAFLFKTDWTAHAEIGLAGDNKLRAKVSPDGSTWITALEIDEATGEVTFPNTVVGTAFLLPYSDFDNSDAIHIYTGWPDHDGHGNWLIRRQVKTTGGYQNATTGATDYASAWASRMTLPFVAP